MSFGRARSPGETWSLARAAGAWAGVTRLADIGRLAGFGLPVFQAVRPYARSLTVAQGKGGTRLAAKISALLEAAELACGEALPRPDRESPLEQLSHAAQTYWAGDRPALTIDLDHALPRAWVDGRLLGTGETMPMPWDLLSLDFTRPPLEFAASSAGLATGNTRDEALLAALCELVEHHLMAGFEDLRPRQRHALEIDTASITDPVFRRELRLAGARGFTPRLWSLGQHHGIAAIACALFPPEPMLDRMAPAAGTACHPDAATAALGALREAVQTRAALVAGARDDLGPRHYSEGRERMRELAAATLALADGALAWSDVPTHDCASTAEAVNVIAEAIARLTPHPVAVFDHSPPADGLSVVHALAPGLRHLSRRRSNAPSGRQARPLTAPPSASRRRNRAILFAGPSICGLAIPSQVELRPPAVCGDLAALAADPPAAVGLVDGHFGIAPTVWHKEILGLLARGVRVMGAASIGALRAAELAEAGMEGIGAIYAAYRRDAIERDDAVMVLQAPADYGFAPLTLSLVEAEYTLLAAACGPGERRMMQRIVRTISYEQRSWRRCLDMFRDRTGADFSVTIETLSAAPSLKRLDAALLIERLRDAARHPGERPSCLAPPLTSHYLKLLARTASGETRVQH